MVEAAAHVEVNEFEAPGPGWHGKSSAFSQTPPGMPFESASKNGSSAPASEKVENFEFTSTPQALEKPATSIIPTSKPVLVGEIIKVGDYKPEYGPRMYEWFCSKEKFRISYDTMVWKNGAVSEKERRIACPPPHFSEFAREIGTTWKVLKAWKKNNREFADYYEACEDIIQEFLIDNGVTGAYSGQFSIFAAKNITKMKDVQINKNENYNMKDVLDAIEKGAKQDPNDL